MPTRISIVTITYNRRKLIADCIESVQNLIVDKTKLEIEHIIYDSASTDKTKEFIKTLSYPNIKYQYSSKKLNIAAARNEAVKLATGDWIFMFDSDDLLFQNSLNAIFDVVEALDPNTWYITNHITVDKNKAYLIGRERVHEHNDTIAKFYEGMFYSNKSIQQTVLFSRMLFDKVKGYDLGRDIGEDQELWLKFLQAKAQIQYLPIYTLIKRSNTSSITYGRTMEEHNKDLAIFYKKYGNDIQKYVSHTGTPWEKYL